jgi:uncharacterized protein
MSRFSETGPTGLEELNEALMSDEAPEGATKILSELDGFLTAVAIGPESLPPSEWLPCIWGDNAPESRSDEQVKTALDLILGRYNQILAELRDDPDSYQPVFWRDEHGRIIVDDWVEGFMDGMALRPEGWRTLLKSREHRHYIAPIAVRFRDAQGNRALKTEESENVKALIEQAAELIPAGVIGIDRFFKQMHQFFSGGTKLGRNDPCFCGSGKKFKKCCGRH